MCVVAHHTVAVGCTITGPWLRDVSTTPSVQQRATGYDCVAVGATVGVRIGTVHHGPAISGTNTVSDRPLLISVNSFIKTSPSQTLMCTNVHCAFAICTPYWTDSVYLF